MTTKVIITEEREDSQNDSSDVACSESDSEHEESNDEEHEGTDAEGSNDEETAKGNLAWADSVSKILKIKPKQNKPLVLSKAKKLTEVKPKPKPIDFEVEQNDGEFKREVITETSEEPEKKRLKKRRKTEMPDIRTKPNILEKDRERVLAKIATKGVVQLFNAVKTQQKDIQEKLKEAGPLEVKKDKVLKSIDKNSFLDVLMSEKSQNVEKVLENSSRKSNKKSENGKVWGVLRDNFMMDAKLKDWDKEMEIEEQSEMEME